MDEETTLMLVVGGIVAYSLLKNDLFKPEGTTQVGLQNIATRTGSDSYHVVDRTYIKVGDTTYSIKDADLNQTGFIRRRAALVSAFPEWLQFDWMKKWIYS